nr:hypothetical protein [uncultured Brevundimonas sp.]
MVGEVLYHLHRHFRLVVIIVAVFALVMTGAMGYAAVRHFAIL